MTREVLKQRAEQEFRYEGTYLGHSKKFKRKTYIVLENVHCKDTGIFVTDHIWIDNIPEIRALGLLKKGDKIEFNATSRLYLKGYTGRRIIHERSSMDKMAIDYMLTRINNVAVHRLEEVTVE